MLRNRTWRLKYTPDDGNLVKLFYVPALEDAKRYDRLTGYFNARALALAARGIEGLVRNNGRMRLVVGCTLGSTEIEAIEKGEELRGPRRTAFGKPSPGSTGCGFFRRLGVAGLDGGAWLPRRQSRCSLRH